MIRLRALVEADLPLLHRWYQDPALWSHLVGAFEPRTEDEAVAYMRRWLSPTSAERRLAIEAEDGLIGQVALSPIEGQEAEFHIFLGRTSDRGRGWGKAATRLMLRLAFGELGLRRVTLKVLASNAAARRVYESLGFEQQPVRERVLKAGVQAEVISMTLAAGRFAGDQDRSAIT